MDDVRTTRITAIESDDYRQEVEALVADPIIAEMVAELPKGWDPEILERWGFVSGASHEYHERGGTNAKSIGGPAREYCNSSGTVTPIANSQLFGEMLTRNTQRAHVRCPRCKRELNAIAKRGERSYEARIPRHKLPAPS
jgi:hypothetical protein